jgi:hypothetical protein
MSERKRVKKYSFIHSFAARDFLPRSTRRQLRRCSSIVAFHAVLSLLLLPSSTVPPACQFFFFAMFQLVPTCCFSLSRSLARNPLTCVRSNSFLFMNNSSAEEEMEERDNRAKYGVIRVLSVLNYFCRQLQGLMILTISCCARALNNNFEFSTDDFFTLSSRHYVTDMILEKKTFIL